MIDESTNCKCQWIRLILFSADFEVECLFDVSVEVFLDNGADRVLYFW